MYDPIIKKDKNKPDDEDGHIREWQDRARVIEPEEIRDNKAAPNQSNAPEEDVEEKSPLINKDKKEDNVY